MKFKAGEKVRIVNYIVPLSPAFYAIIKDTVPFVNLGIPDTSPDAYKYNQYIADLYEGDYKHPYTYYFFERDLGKFETKQIEEWE